MKATMKKENGVYRENIDGWLIQYTFKCRYILGKSIEDMADIYVIILTIFFELNH